MRLTKLQKQLCNALQDGLPICDRPFAQIAKDLNSDEKTVLEQTSELKKSGVVRRFRAVINYRALGKVSTLVAAHVPDESFQEVAEAVNSTDGVSHNYRRGHFYNLWFTLQMQRAAQIKAVLSELSGRFGIEFHSLPVKRFFKLDVRFDAEKGALRNCSGLSAQKGRAHGPAPIILNAKQKLVLSKLQGELDLVSGPFAPHQLGVSRPAAKTRRGKVPFSHRAIGAGLCSEGLEKKEILAIITELIDKGVIRRIAAVVDHRKLGFVANVLFCGEVAQERIVKAGKRLACFRAVSHCYERETFQDWPYNLFAMMHARSMEQIQQVIDKFIEAERIDSFELLPTVAELKKQPVEHKFY